ncbi:MAG: Spy/CpxP family protein refolding chaperone [Longimicrobiales bacterium]
MIRAAARGVGGAMLAVTLASFMWTGSAEAQRRPGMDRAQLEQRIRARFDEMVRERLGLTEEEGRALGAVVASFEPARRTLRQEERTLRRAVATLLEDAPGNDARATELLRDLADLRVREARLFAEEQERLLEVLTPSQILRFHAVREELNQRIRRLRGGGPGGRAGPGNGAPAGAFDWSSPPTG